MTDLQLSDGRNWNLILSQSRAVTYYPDRVLSGSLYEYDPIQPIYVSPQSHLLLVGTRSESALPYWFLGARASQFLYVSPLGTSYDVSGIQAEESKKVGLNQITLIKFQDYGVSPYVLELKIPHWIEDIQIDVWEYSNPAI